MNNVYTELLKVARSHPFSFDRETGPYPTTTKVPQRFLIEFGVKLERPDDYVLVLEIQFDTEKILFQSYDREGEFYDGVFSYDLKNLSIDFQKWLKDSISKNIKFIHVRKMSKKYGL